MQHPMLKITVSGAHRAVEPRRDKNAERRDTLRVNVEKAENLGFGITESMQHGAGFKSGISRQIHHKFHTHRPITFMVIVRHIEMSFELLTDGTNWPIANNCERRADVHARCESS